MTFEADTGRFNYSIKYRLTCAAIMVLCSLFIAFLDLYYSLPLSSLWLPIGAFLSALYFLYLTLKWRTWRADFYDTYFQVRGWGFSKNYLYSDIKEVTLIKPGWPSAGVSMSIRGQNQQLAIPANPKNREANTHLYEWLQEKAKNSGESLEKFNN